MNVGGISRRDRAATAWFRFLGKVEHTHLAGDAGGGGDEPRSSFPCVAESHSGWGSNRHHSNFSRMRLPTLTCVEPGQCMASSHGQLPHVNPDADSPNGFSREFICQSESVP